MTKNAEDLYNLKLHDVLNVSEINATLGVQAVRVPGGWIYNSFDKSRNIMGSVFVPFDNEFQRKWPGEHE